MRIWILGAGGFGKKALERLSVWRPRPDILVVDVDEKALGLLESKADSRLGDGPSFLAQNLKKENEPEQPDWIVPAIGVHVAFEWLKLSLEKTHKLREIPVPDEMEPLVPHPLRGKGGELYMSLADSLCPSDCPGPDGRCVKTGEPRPLGLDRLLKGIRLPGWRMVTVTSRQMAPGVGGYRPEDLFQARQRVLEDEGKPVFFSTASACHGVAQALVIDSLGS